MADTRDKAVAAAYDYIQHNVAVLNDYDTRRLVASVIHSESRTGDLALTSPNGFVGRYQAGASLLAEVGYVDQGKLNIAMQDHRSEWSWAKTGGMSSFLEDPSNWKNGLSLDKYKASPELQDYAFKTHADHAYQRAATQGLLSEDDKPERIAGFLKAEYVAGYGAAAEALKGGRAIRDATGNTNYDYMHDITRNRDGLDNVMQRWQAHTFGSQSKVEALQGEAEMGELKIGAITRNKELPNISYTSHPDHSLYKDAWEGIQKLPAGTFKNDEERQNAAAQLALQAKIEGLHQIDHVVHSTRGNSLIAVQGNLHDPSHKRAVVEDTNQAVAQSLEKTTSQIEQYAMSQQQTQIKQQEQDRDKDKEQEKQTREPPKQQFM